MSATPNLVDQIAAKPNEELLAMLKEPDDWLPDVLEAARLELRRRGIVVGEMTVQPKAATESAASHERPPAITVICIIGFVGAPITMLLGILFQLNPAISVPSWHPAFMMVAGAWRLGCMIGLWRMSRTAFVAWLFYMCVSLAVLMILSPRAFAIGLVPFAIELAVVCTYFHRPK